MKTLRSAPIVALLGLALAVALVGSSCSAANPVALQVGDWQLSSSDFQEQLTDFYDATSAAEGATSAAALRGTTEGTWSTRYTAFMLNVQALSRIAQQAAADRGIEITDADLAQARSAVEGQFADASGTSYFDTLPESYTDALLHGVAAENLLAEAVVAESTTDDALRNLFDQSPEYQADQVCASHILILAGNPDGQTTPSDADYADALARVEEIRNGLTPENFASVAAAESDDTGSAAQGGDLGCAPEGSYVAGFEEAVWSQPVGEVGEPVKTSYGYHLILVRSRGPVSFEDVKDQLVQKVQNSVQSLLTPEYIKVADAIGVTVDGRYGQWDQQTARVVEPSGPDQPASSATDLSSLLGTSGATAQ